MLNSIDFYQTNLIWEKAKKIRWKDLEKNDCTGGQFRDDDIRNNTLNMIRALNISEQNIDSAQSISENIFEEALSLFAYLNFCPEEIFHSPFTKLTRDVISNLSLDRIVLFLNRVLVKNEKSWAKVILKKILDNFEFEYENIDMLAKGLSTDNIGYDWNLLHELSNHPVQIMKDKRNMSTSSFIPYCYFGVESNQFGLEIDGFEFPVCNIFQAKILNDQLCYEVDINELIEKDTSEKDLKAGLTLLVDYNEDRTVSLIDNTDKLDKNEDIDDEDKMMIYIHSIGK